MPTKDAYFEIAAEYLHTLQHRRLLLPLTPTGTVVVPVTVIAVTLDPDVSQIILTGGTPFGAVIIRLEATELVYVEA